MKHPTGYYCKLCQTYHLSAGNYEGKPNKAQMTKLYRNHYKYRRNEPA